jgi:hypothetical protein
MSNIPVADHHIVPDIVARSMTVTRTLPAKCSGHAGTGCSPTDREAALHFRDSERRTPDFLRLLRA